MSMFKKYASVAILVSVVMSWNFGTIGALFEGIEEEGNVKVEVYPSFPSGVEQSFKIHCESKDDNLGEHVIAPPDFYHFSFDPSLFGNTLFHCRVVWTNRAVSFAVYDQKRDQDKRGSVHFRWRVLPDGVHGFAEGATLSDLNYAWTT